MCHICRSFLFLLPQRHVFTVLLVRHGEEFLRIGSGIVNIHADDLGHQRVGYTALLQLLQRFAVAADGVDIALQIVQFQKRAGLALHGRE